MTSPAQRLTITAPDDWHIHLRDAQALELTVAHAARSFRRVIVMPNLAPPVVNAAQALAYKQRIMNVVGMNSEFEPLMVIYLTDKTSAEQISEASKAGVTAAKLYPAGATTNSDSGVTSIKYIYPALEAMQRCGMPLLVHGETTDHHIDIFEREAVFIEQTMRHLTESFTELKVVFEHITTADAVDFVRSTPTNVGATITAHHLLYNRNHMLAGGIRPHYYCLPILKHRQHQQALIDAATSGNASFFLGTDSAPHTQQKKESDCGCAGAYTAYSALEFYAEIFEAAGALDKLEAFASFNGPDFYALPRNTATVSLVKHEHIIPDSFDYMDERLIPLNAGKMLTWQLEAN